MRLLNKKFARKTAAAALVLATAATLATGAFAAEDDGVVAGYMPPQEVMVQDRPGGQPHSGQHHADLCR